MPEPGIHPASLLTDSNGVDHPGPWRYPEARVRELDAQERIHRPRKKGGVPRIKRYLHENDGQVPPNIWSDIAALHSRAQERTGYPTQKPLELLNRIIQASSKPGDLVLDPFCGCATTCVAAELAERQWAGIDLSAKAVHLLQQRLAFHAKQGQLFGASFDPIVRTDLPRRTDINDASTRRGPDDKHVLYGRQEGRCNGCRHHFPFRNMTVDHIIARSHGGHDGIDNLQLLCGACNSTKGSKSQEALIARLKETGVRR